ncbi:twin-arginine translocase subunit TatC [Microbacteriaceae bacterium 4G12]
MSIIDHLSEVRKRIIVTLVVFLLFLIVGFVYVSDIYELLTKSLSFKLTVLGPGDVLWVYFSLAGVFAIACTLPVAVLQLWLFVRPALHPSERKATLLYIPALFLLFITGLSVGYFFVVPNIFHFLSLLGGDMFKEMYTVEKYFTFVFNLVVPFALFFDLPVIMMFLTRIGIVQPFYLQKMRRYAYFVLVIIACCISPPDFVSHISVSVPLILLYECSVFASIFVYKRKQKRGI